MKHLSMLISIIVPVYKVEPYLHRCVDSVLAQTYTNWELILVDDGSPDMCPIICDDYAEKDERIIVIHKANGGQADARNYGLDISSGEYIMFLDSDDYIHPNMLKNMVETSLQEDADIVQCTFVRGSENVFPTIREESSLHRFDNHTIFYSARQKLILWAKLYRKKLWEGIRIPTGIYYEDDASTWKLYYKSEKTVLIDIPYYYYYVNSNSTMANHKKRPSMDFIKIYQERIAFFKEKQEEDLVRISQWRFCMPLMLIYVSGNITKEEKRYILSIFKENIADVLTCKRVPIKYRLVLVVFNACPIFFRWLFETFNKAQTIKE